MRIAVLVYDFPHRKSQDFLTRLWLDGHDVDCVIGSPFQPLKRPEERLRVKPRGRPAVHPRDICDRIGVQYISADHKDPDLPRRLSEMNIDLGLIAGARILLPNLISAPSIGIINFHPGLLPEARGLDALKWSVYKGVAPGVTVHFIDHRVDAGKVILRKEIPVYPDDGWVDLSLRLEDTELDLITPTLMRLKERPDIALHPEAGNSPLNSAMSPEIQEETAKAFSSWREHFSKGGYQG